MKKLLVVLLVLSIIAGVGSNLYISYSYEQEIAQIERDYEHKVDQREEEIFSVMNGLPYEIAIERNGEVLRYSDDGKNVITRGIDKAKEVIATKF